MRQNWILKYEGLSRNFGPNVILRINVFTVVIFVWFVEFLIFIFSDPSFVPLTAVRFQRRVNSVNLNHVRGSTKIQYHTIKPFPRISIPS